MSSFTVDNEQKRDEEEENLKWHNVSHFSPFLSHMSSKCSMSALRVRWLRCVLSFSREPAMETSRWTRWMSRRLASQSQWQSQEEEGQDVLVYIQEEDSRQSKSCIWIGVFPSQSLQQELLWFWRLPLPECMDSNFGSTGESICSSSPRKIDWKTSSPSSHSMTLFLWLFVVVSHSLC